MRAIKNSTYIVNSLFLLVFSFIFLMCTESFAAPADHVPGQYLVKLRAGALQASHIHRLRALGIKVSDPIPETNIIVVERSTRESAKEAIKIIKQNPLVEYAEPNYIFRVNRLPEDPLFSKQWALRNVGQRDDFGEAGIAGVDIGVEGAWDLETGSSDVVVAVIDTGVNLQLSDLKSNLWINTAERDGLTGVDDDGNGWIDDVNGYDFVNAKAEPLDDLGHGSHVAGIIGAAGNDGQGMTGISWKVRLMPLKALGRSGEGTSQAAIEAIHYAIRMGAKIINASWGGSQSSQLVEEAIREASDKNILFVAAAGNSGTDNDQRPHFPASYSVPSIISVAAVDPQGKLASFSCYGKKSVHIAAPGTRILSASLKGYVSHSGTSMAAPHVSGVAALVLSREPHLSALEVKERLLETARPMDSLLWKTVSKGIVNANYALRKEIPPPAFGDPAHWEKVKILNFSTTHPYENQKELEWVVKIPGAKRISLYFEKFETEDPYDRVTLFNANGVKIQSFAGTEGLGWTQPLSGDTVKIVFRSNARNNFYGFDLTRAAYQ